MKKILLILILGLFLISTVSSFGFSDTNTNLGTFKKGTCISLYQSCDNCTYVNLTKVQSPNGSITTINKAMTKDDVDYNYSFCNAIDFGTYYYIVKGDFNGVLKTERLNFDINYFGKKLTNAQSIIYVILLSLLVFILFGTLFGMGFLPSSNTTNPEGAIMSITWLKYLRLPLWIFSYFLLIAILFLSSNVAYAFLSEQLFGKMFFTLFTIVLAISPLIIILTFLSFILKFYEDKEFQRYLNRGIFPVKEL